MINKLIKNLELMVSAIGEEGTEESINVMFEENCIQSIKELNESIETELSYMADT